MPVLDAGSVLVTTLVNMPVIQGADGNLEFVNNNQNKMNIYIYGINTHGNHLEALAVGTQYRVCGKFGVRNFSIRATCTLWNAMH
jgi:hypothetical protein